MAPLPILLFLVSLSTASVAGNPGLINLSRCAEAKAKDPSLLAIVSIVSSAAHELNMRQKLREKVFGYVQSLHERRAFRPAVRARGFRAKKQQDIRRVCLQSLFVISPWKELCHRFKSYKNMQFSCMPSQDVFRGIVNEAEAHQDVLIAPTIINNTTRARELMHVLKWSRSRVPWADYVISSDADTHINWDRMIELFPPPHKSDSLWYLGMGSEPNLQGLFFRNTHHSDWKPCAAGVLHGFSRDLVKKIANAPIASQLHVAFKFPLHVQLRENSQPGV